MSEYVFPTNPSDGDTVTVSGITYTYVAASGSVPEHWKNNVIGMSGNSLTIGADSGSDDTLVIGTDTLTISGDTGITTTVTDNEISIDLDNTAVTQGTYGSSSQTPVFVVDATGRITSATNVNSVPSGALTISSTIDTVNATAIQQGVQYHIATIGTTDFETDFGATEDSSESLTTNEDYIISSPGTTNWVLCGAANNNPGTKFRATGSAAGTGKALRRIFTASSAGTGSSGTGVVNPNTLHYVTFATGTSGAQTIKANTGLSYNPNTGNLTASNLQGSFIGNVSGNLVGNVTGNVTGNITGTVTGGASSASTVIVANNSAASDSMFVLFADGAAGNSEAVEGDNTFRFKPSTDTLTIANLNTTEGLLKLASADGADDLARQSQVVL